MAVIRMLRGTSTSWALRNPVLDAGVEGYETDTHRYKIGDGVTKWNDLTSYLPEVEMLRAITAAITAAGVGTPGVSHEELELHINSPTPHPAYDDPDGPSLLLLYKNAKV